MDGIFQFFISKLTAEFLVREKTPQEMRDAITHRCAQMLATYREKCNEQVPVGQLILPESLKLLPLFGNCIIKNDAVSGGWLFFLF